MKNIARYILALSLALSSAFAAPATSQKLTPIGTNPVGMFEVANVESIAELKAINTGNNGYNVPLLVHGSFANVLGYFSKNDGGNGVFVFDAYSSAASDDVLTIAPTQGVGRWIKQLSGDELYAEEIGIRAGDVSTYASANTSALNTWLASEKTIRFRAGKTYCFNGQILMKAVNSESKSGIVGDSHFSSVLKWRGNTNESFIVLGQNSVVDNVQINLNNIEGVRGIGSLKNDNTTTTPYRAIIGKVYINNVGANAVGMNFVSDTNGFSHVNIDWLRVAVGGTLIDGGAVGMKFQTIGTGYLSAFHINYYQCLDAYKGIELKGDTNPGAISIDGIHIENCFYGIDIQKGEEIVINGGDIEGNIINIFVEDNSLSTRNLFINSSLDSGSLNGWRLREINSKGVKWTLSASGTNEYYCVRKDDTNPNITSPSFVYFGSTALTSGTVGSLAAGAYAFADNDTLGFSTLYVRLPGAASDPDPDLSSSIVESYKRLSYAERSVYFRSRNRERMLSGRWFLEGRIDGKVNGTYSGILASTRLIDVGLYRTTTSSTGTFVLDASSGPFINTLSATDITISSISGGTDANPIIVIQRAGSGNITLQNSATVALRGGSNWVSNAVNDSITLIYNSGSAKWIEIARTQ